VSNKVNLDNYEDFELVDTPKDKAKEDYDPSQRRADMLSRIKTKGTPRLNQNKMADRYGVAQSRISHDLKVIRAYLADKTAERFDGFASATFENSVHRLMIKGEEYKASKVITMWADWLFDTGRKEREPERHEVKQDVTREDFQENLAEVYKKLTQDGAETSSEDDQESQG